MSLSISTSSTMWICNVCSNENMGVAEGACTFCGTPKDRATKARKHPQPQDNSKSATVARTPSRGGRLHQQSSKKDPEDFSSPVKKTELEPSQPLPRLSTGEHTGERNREATDLTPSQILDRYAIQSAASEEVASSPRPPPRVQSKPPPVQATVPLPASGPDVEAASEPLVSTQKSFEKKEDDETTWATLFRRIFAVAAVAAVVALSFTLIHDEEGDNAVKARAVLVTIAPSTQIRIPTGEPTVAPTHLIEVRPSNRPSNPPSDTSIPTNSPTDSTPSTSRPSDAPAQATQSPVTPTGTPTSETKSPTGAPHQAFDSENTFHGIGDGARYGSIVVLNDAGSIMGVMDSDGNVQVFQLSSAQVWIEHSSITADPAMASPHMTLDISSPGGTLVLAVASSSSLRVLRYTNGQWVARGQQNIGWVAEDGVTPVSFVSLSEVAISSDGNTLAAGSISGDGSSLLVRVWDWTGGSWALRGNPIVRTTDDTVPFLSTCLSLSRDGNVVSLGDWKIANPASIVETFEWDGVDWSRRGGELSFPWGPVAVALTGTGDGVAVTTPRPGWSQVYTWDSDNSNWERVGQDMLGGSSIALSDSGDRVVVGIALSSEVWVYDLLQTTDEFTSESPLAGLIGSQYGSSIALSAGGDVLAVGSPLDDSHGTDVGQVFLYE